MFTQLSLHAKLSEETLIREDQPCRIRGIIDAGALPMAKPSARPAATAICHSRAYFFSSRMTSGMVWFCFAKSSIAIACGSIPYISANLAGTRASQHHQEQGRIQLSTNLEDAWELTAGTESNCVKQQLNGSHRSVAAASMAT